MRIVRGVQLKLLMNCFMKIARYLPLMLTTVILVGCSDTRCIDADDFGFPEIRVPARYKKEDVLGKGVNQVVPWIDTGLQVDPGKPLVVLVKNWSSVEDSNNEEVLSAWSTWYGTKDDGNKLSKLVYRLQTCKFENDDMCTDTITARINNAPCIFRKGVGLYGLVSDKREDPNANSASQREPLGPTFHVGEVGGANFYDVNNFFKWILS